LPSNAGRAASFDALRCGEAIYFELVGLVDAFVRLISSR
jgi:hypothetical protein